MTSHQKGKENEKNFLKLLGNESFWKPNFIMIFKELGINDNKTGFRIFHRLKEKGLLNEKLRPIITQVLYIDTSGTKNDAAILDK